VPAVKLIDAVPWPPVIVPFVIVQLNTPDAPEADAPFPVEAGQTIAGAVTVSVPAALMGTVAPEVSLQAPCVMESPRVTVPEVPAVKAIVLVPWPDVIVPLEMVHAYDEAPGIAEATFPVAFAQVTAGAEIAADTMGTWAAPFDEQLFFVTVTLSPTGPVVPAEKLIELLPCPAVMLPFVMAQT
jgi:hypothetical protein